MKETYLATIVLLERMHRQFFEVIKSELEGHDIRDINNVQALILYNIGGDELTVGELTLRGYYLGSNVSYNVKKMTEHGYLHQERSSHDRRSVRVKLTEKGLELSRLLEQMFERHVEAVADSIDEDKLGAANESLRDVERFWLQRLGFRAWRSSFGSRRRPRRKPTIHRRQEKKGRLHAQSPFFLSGCRRLSRSRQACRSLDSSAVASSPCSANTCLSLPRALASIWRMRSLLTPKLSPISERVFFFSCRNLRTMI
jgi:DNA-binding MarR family transcriptional regulator